MSMKCLALSVSFSLLLSNAALAEIYKSVDKDGNVTYTDQAADNSTEVKVKISNSVPAVAAPTPAPTVDDEETAVRYKTLKIVSPADDSGIEHGPGNFTVKTSIKPALADGHAMQLFIDGAAHGKPSGRTSFKLTNVYRGTHILQVKVLSADGEVIKSSKPSSVHVFRPSVLLPGSQR
mgnify:FL=1